MGAQRRRRPWPRSRRTAAARRGTPRRRPRWRRCRPPARCRPRSPRLAGPARPPGRPRRRAGRTPRSPAWSSRPAGAASGTRSGQARPSAIGISMSGGQAWTSVEPSTNSTIECTTQVGCTTTSMRSKGMPKSRCASITSRPLLTRVAELIVMTGPMSQVGWASACSGVTSASSLGGAAAERARRSRSAPGGVPPRRVPPRRHWASAECSESTGTIWPGLARPVTSGPPMISDSLLARASVLPASRAASVGRSPTAPVMPLSTTSQRDGRPPRPRPPPPARSTPARTRRPAARTARGCDPPAVSPTTRNRSGLARTRSRAWVPIDPVEPRMTMSRCAIRTMLPIRCQSDACRVSAFHPFGHYVASQDRRRQSARGPRERHDRTMKRSRLLALVTAATTVAALAACAAPEDDNEATTTESGVSAAEATSAEDFGGMDALVEAAQEEGTLNVIALPPDWANYGEIIDTFAEKYDIKVNSDQPTGGQPGRDQRGQRPQGHRQGARRLRPRPVGGSRQHRPVRAVQGRDLRRHPRRVQGPRRRLGQRLRRLHGDRLRLRQGPRRHLGRRPAQARVQGRGRAQRRPDRRPARRSAA